MSRKVQNWVWIPDLIPRFRELWLEKLTGRRVAAARGASNVRRSLSVGLWAALERYDRVGRGREFAASPRCCSRSSS